MKQLITFLSFLFCVPLLSYELAIVAIFRDEAFYLKEWIEYHRMAGVDRFLLYNNESIDHWRDILQPYIEHGLVEVFEWPTISVGDGNPQLQAYKDGIARTRGKTKWVALIDLDEFLLPMQNRSILDCLNEHYSDAAGVFVNWRCFGTNFVSVPKGDPFLFHLTGCSHTIHSRNAVGKSIVRPEYVDLENIWNPHHFMLMSDAHYYANGNGKRMEFNGIELVNDGTHYESLIRINHYILRDEHHYLTVRSGYTCRGYGEQRAMLLNHYTEFSKIQETSIVDFIQKNYPEESRTLWHH